MQVAASQPAPASTPTSGIPENLQQAAPGPSSKPCPAASSKVQDGPLHATASPQQQPRPVLTPQVGDQMVIRSATDVSCQMIPSAYVPSLSTSVACTIDIRMPQAASQVHVIHWQMHAAPHCTAGRHKTLDAVFERKRFLCRLVLHCWFSRHTWPTSLHHSMDMLVGHHAALWTE